MNGKDWVPYVEALPRVNLVTAYAQWRRGRPRPYWYTETGTFAGCGTVTRFDRSGFAIDVITASVGMVKQSMSNVSFDLAWSQRSGRERPYAICPECRKRAGAIVFFDLAWLCMDCHGVGCFAAMVDPDVAVFQYYVGLKQLIKDGRPKNMHHDKFDALKRELSDLDREWSNYAPISLSGDLQYRVDTVFFSEADRPKDYGPRALGRPSRGRPRKSSIVDAPNALTDEVCGPVHHVGGEQAGAEICPGLPKRMRVWLGGEDWAR